MIDEIDCRSAWFSSEIHGNKYVSLENFGRVFRESSSTSDSHDSRVENARRKQASNFVSLSTPAAAVRYIYIYIYHISVLIYGVFV